MLYYSHIQFGKSSEREENDDRVGNEGCEGGMDNKRACGLYLAVSSSMSSVVV